MIIRNSVYSVYESIFDQPMAGHIATTELDIRLNINKQHLDFNEDTKIKFSQMLNNATNISKFNKIINYLLNQNSQGVVVAKELLLKYVRQVSEDVNVKPLELEKSQKCLMLAARLGDMQLFDNMSKYVSAFDEQNQPIKDGNGKTLLHYVCQSQNAELVVKIYNDMKKRNIHNPFQQYDNYRINPLRPQDYIMPGLAEKLDHLMKLDGNKKGSFSNLVRYNQITRKNLKQGASNYLRGISQSEGSNIEHAMIGGKYLGGVGVVATNEALIASYGSMAANIVTSAEVGASIVAVGAVIAAGANFKRYLQYRNQFTDKLNLESSIQQAQVKQNFIEFKADDPHYNIMQALEKGNFTRIVQDIKDPRFKQNKTKIIAALEKVNYFPVEPENLKQDIFYNLALKTSPRQMERLISGLANRSDDNSELSQTIIAKVIAKLDSNTNLDTRSEDVTRLKRCCLMAAKFGNVDLLKQALKALAGKGVTKLLDITNEKNENLLHYATKKADNFEVIKLIEPIMSQELRLQTGGISKHNNIFEIQDDKGNKPKHYLRRSDANKLDQYYGLDQLGRNGFSGYVAEANKRLSRDKYSNMFSTAAVTVAATGGIITAVPYFISAGVFVATKAGMVSHSLFGRTAAHYAISAAVEGTSSVVSLKGTENFAIPIVGRAFKGAVNKLYSKYVELRYNSNPYKISKFDDQIIKTSNLLIAKINQQLTEDKSNINSMADIEMAIDKVVNLELAQVKDLDLKKQKMQLVNNILAETFAHNSDYKLVIKTFQDMAKHSQDTQHQVLNNAISEVTDKYIKAEASANGRVQSINPFKQIFLTRVKNNYIKSLENIRDLTNSKDAKTAINKLITSVAEKGVGGVPQSYKRNNSKNELIDVAEQISKIEIGHDKNSAAIKKINKILVKSKNPKLQALKDHMNTLSIDTDVKLKEQLLNKISKLYEELDRSKEPVLAVKSDVKQKLKPKQEVKLTSQELEDSFASEYLTKLAVKKQWLSKKLNFGTTPMILQECYHLGNRDRFKDQKGHAGFKHILEVAFVMQNDLVSKVIENNQSEQFKLMLHQQIDNFDVTKDTRLTIQDLNMAVMKCIKQAAEDCGVKLKAPDMVGSISPDNSPGHLKMGHWEDN